MKEKEIQRLTNLIWTLREQLNAHDLEYEEIRRPPGWRKVKFRNALHRLKRWEDKRIALLMSGIMQEMDKKGG